MGFLYGMIRLMRPCGEQDTAVNLHLHRQAQREDGGNAKIHSLSELIYF